MSGLQIERFEDRASWLEARAGSLGGSDVAGVLGLSPWSSALEVWARLRGAAPPQETLAMRRGSALEGLIVDEIAAEAGAEIVDRGLVMARRDDRPGEHFSPDAIAMLDGRRVLIEAKSTVRWDDWSDDVPPWVWAQAQHGLDILGLDLALVGCLVLPRDEVRWSRVERAREWEQAARPGIEEFLAFLRRGEPPPPDGSESAGRVLAGRERREKAARFLDAPEVERVEQWRRAHDALAAAEHQEALARQLVLDALGDVSVGLLPGGRAVVARGARLQHSRRVPRGLRIEEQL